MDSTITEEAMLAMAEKLRNDTGMEYSDIDECMCDAANMLLTLAAERNTQSCTCHPDDNPPRPCPRQYALSECRKVASERAQQTGRVMDESAKSALQAYINVSGIVDTPGGDYLPIDEDAMRAALEAIAPMLHGVPDGWKLMPVEFTRDIERIITNEACVYQSARQLYAALLAASPSQEKDNG